MSPSAVAATFAAFLSSVFVVAAGPIPTLAFILQSMATGGAVGLLVAYRAKMRDPATDPWIITARWSIVFLAVGVLVVVAEAIGELA